jgi:hypothetical protein
MKLMVTYFPLLSKKEGKGITHKIGKDELLAFEQASGVELARDPAGKLTNMLGNPQFEVGSAREERFKKALETCSLDTKADVPIGYYDTEDYESAELLSAAVPDTKRSIHKSPHPGTLLYRGNPPFFEPKLLKKHPTLAGDPPDISQILTVDSTPLKSRPIIMSQKHLSAFIRDDLKRRWEEAGLTGIHYWECVCPDPAKPKIYGLTTVGGPAKIKSNTPGRQNGEPVLRIAREQLATSGSVATYIFHNGEPILLFRPDAYQATKHVRGIEWFPVGIVD